MRNLRKNTAFSFINIFGLAIGLTSFMLISAFVYNELSYDKYPENAKDIYRVETIHHRTMEAVDVYPKVDVAVGEGIKRAFPEVQASTRLSTAIDFIQYDDKQFKENQLAYVDSNFLQMFSIPLIEGNIQNAFVQPNSIVISKAFAKKYFGDKKH